MGCGCSKNKSNQRNSSTPRVNTNSPNMRNKTTNRYSPTNTNTKVIRNRGRR